MALKIYCQRRGDNMNFEAIIGLEIHIQMKTKSKLFSSAPVSFGDVPNTQIMPFDMAFPGTMPLINKQAVINAIRVCNALHMRIDSELWFDRKNYFYSDLPKGFQITQEARPIGSDGWIDIKTKNGTKRIGVQRLHIEEDTCKQTHAGEYTFLDYNRAGIPLIEIVTNPVIQNGEEAMRFVEKIRSIVTFLNVSDGKMEEGSLRCDVNVSIRPYGSNLFGTKVEIKNLNSITNIQKAIDYEIARQASVILQGGKNHQETRRFDEAKKETTLMRVKTDAIDYKCFTEPNIVPTKLSKEFIDDAIKTSPELAEAKLERYQKIGLNEYDSQLLIANKDVSEYFDAVIACGANPKLAANWINVDVQSVLNKNMISIKEFEISAQNLAKLIVMIEKKTITNKQAREIFEEMLKGDNNPENIVKTMDVTLINDEEVLLKIIKQLFWENSFL